jgi:hypothetical protein
MARPVKVLTANSEVRAELTRRANSRTGEHRQRMLRRARYGALAASLSAQWLFQRMRSRILSSPARAQVSSALAVGAPPTPIAPMTSSPSLIVSPQGADHSNGMEELM